MCSAVTSPLSFSLSCTRMHTLYLYIQQWHKGTWISTWAKQTCNLPLLLDCFSQKTAPSPIQLYQAKTRTHCRYIPPSYKYPTTSHIWSFLTSSSFRPPHILVSLSSPLVSCHTAPVSQQVAHIHSASPAVLHTKHVPSFSVWEFLSWPQSL